MAKFSTFGMLGLLVMVGMGFIIYLRMWNVEADLDLKNDAGIDRIEFERVHNEALDEAAEWRKKYDAEAEKASDHFQKFLQVSQTLEEKSQRLENLEARLTSLQKENHGLLKEVARLKRELEEQKVKCEKRRIKEV